MLARGVNGSAWCLCSRYATTIHAASSCTIKLSKLTRAGSLYRGCQRAALPKVFWEGGDEARGRGGVEFGFTSTTADRSIAVFYSGGDTAGKASTIFEASGALEPCPFPSALVLTVRLCVCAPIFAPPLARPSR